VDYTRGGTAIGIEITTPGAISLAAFNRLLRELGHKPITRADISPLLAA
jgi:hypothetical protein